MGPIQEPALNLRDRAKGEQCYLRLFDDDGNRICNGDSRTVVLCHIRIGGVGSMGKRPPDICALPACSSCHDRFDGRRHDPVSDLVDNALRGQNQWLAKCFNNGWIKVG